MATLRAVEEQRANEALFVPTMTIAVLEAARSASYDVTSLQTVMSAAAPRRAHGRGGVRLGRSHRRRRRLLRGARPRGADRLLPRRLARFKVPAHVMFLRADELPTTATGKVQKFRLIERAGARRERVAGDGSRHR